MPGNPLHPDSAAQPAAPDVQSLPVLGIDTCGPSGSVALARLFGASGQPEVEVLGQAPLEGRSYSATLIAAIGDLLRQAGLKLRDMNAIVAVSGPGSFTGVRVGLSAAKGLAEAAPIPIVAVSRLEVLAFKSGVPAAALDAHRSEVFLRLAAPGEEATEVLAGGAELAAIPTRPPAVAVCDQAAALLSATWPATRFVPVEAPTAADAIRLAASRIFAREFADPLLLDGHYLRRSDAEIFGEPAAPGHP